MKAPTLFTPFAATLFSIMLLAADLPIRPAIAQPLPTLPLEFNPDSLANPGRPGGRRRGGGSRGGCTTQLPLTAIAYARTAVELGVETPDETAGTFTTQAQPTLWFYLPTALSDGIEASLILKSSDDELIYQGQLADATERDGIVRVAVPVDLALDTPYHWFLTMVCTQSEQSTVEQSTLEQSSSEQSTVDGWIERRASDAAFNSTLMQANARNRAALYANEGFLQDALSELALLRMNNPDNEALAQDWANFLNTLGLSELATIPLLDCCQLATVQSPISIQTIESDLLKPTPEGSAEL